MVSCLCFVEKMVLVETDSLPFVREIKKSDVDGSSSTWVRHDDVQIALTRGCLESREPVANDAMGECRQLLIRMFFVIEFKKLILSIEID